jgi:hypothetical protein
MYSIYWKKREAQGVEKVIKKNNKKAFSWGYCQDGLAISFTAK